MAIFGLGRAPPPDPSGFIVTTGASKGCKRAVRDTDGERPPYCDTRWKQSGLRVLPWESRFGVNHSDRRYAEAVEIAPESARGDGRWVRGYAPVPPLPHTSAWCVHSWLQRGGETKMAILFCPLSEGTPVLMRTPRPMRWNHPPITYQSDKGNIFIQPNSGVTLSPDYEIPLGKRPKP